jgi:lysophospholipase L1-like esterase
MPYTPQTWADGSGGGTPITAATLTHIESGIDTATDTADAAVPLSAVGQQQLEVQRLTALRSWHAALAGRRYAACNVAVLGSSSTEGTGADAYERRYLHRLTAALRAAAPTPGVVGGDNYTPASGSGATFTWPLVRTGGSNSTATGWALRAALLTTTGNNVTYTTQASSFEVWYSQFTTGGIFSVTIDGTVVAASVNTAGTLDRNAKWTSAALAPGTHTITVTWVSTANVFIYGIASYNGDESAGIRVFDGGLSGLQSGDLVTNSAQWTPRLTGIDADLVIYQIGANDYTSNVVPATFKSNVQSIIASIRSGSPGAPSIVLTMAPLTASTTQTYTWAQYQQAVYEIAAADTGGPGGASGVVVWDAALRWDSPYTDNSLAIFAGDMTHMTNLGHQLFASDLAAFLLTGFEGADPYEPAPLPQEWGASTRYRRGQKVTRNGCTFQVTADYTSGSTLPSSNLLMVDAPFQGQPLLSGSYTIIGAPASNTTNGFGNGNLRAIGWYLPHGKFLTRIGSEVSTVGQVGSKIRLGLYADDGSMRPGALLVDAGQIAGDSATFQDLTLGTPLWLPPGLYWAAAVVQAVTTTQPTLRTGTALIPITHTSATTNTSTWFHQNSETGALPAAFIPSGGSNVTPRIHVRTG